MNKRQKIELQKYYTDAHNHVQKRLKERYPEMSITIKDLKEAPYLKLFPTRGDNNWVTACEIQGVIIFYVRDRVTKLFNTVLSVEQVRDRIRDWGLGITFTDEELREGISSYYNTIETWKEGRR